MRGHPRIGNDARLHKPVQEEKKYRGQSRRGREITEQRHSQTDRFNGGAQRGHEGRTPVPCSGSNLNHLTPIRFPVRPGAEDTHVQIAVPPSTTAVYCVVAGTFFHAEPLLIATTVISMRDTTFPWTAISAMGLPPVNMTNATLHAGMRDSLLTVCNA